jgi:hemerythrin
MKYDSELVSWSPTFSVGVKIIDDQHKELLNLTNDLFNHSTGDPEQEAEYFNKVIHQAVDYVKVHFATEEKIMKATRFDGYTAHKQEHDVFVLTTVEAVKEFNVSKKINLVQFTRFLKDWILTHIAVMDKGYFEYFKKIATKKADGKLSITKEDINRVALGS